MRPTLSVVEPVLVQRIIDEALTVLERVGVQVDEPRAAARLASLGLPVDGRSGRVTFPRARVEQALATAPSSLTLQRSADGLLRGYRNGYEDKQVQTGEGPLHLKMPQVRNTIDAFESVWLQALVRRSDKLAALIPQLCVKECPRGTSRRR